MAALRVDPEFLRERLGLPPGTKIVGAEMVGSIGPVQVIFDLAGPDVPECKEVRAIFTQTCKLEVDDERF